MQSQRIPDQGSTARLSEEQIDNAVLDFMLCEPSWPWSLEEVARELGSQPNAADAVRRLTSAGLLHRLDNFVFPSRAARRANELQIGSV